TIIEQRRMAPILGGRDRRRNDVLLVRISKCRKTGSSDVGSFQLICHCGLYERASTTRDAAHLAFRSVWRRNDSGIPQFQFMLMARRVRPCADRLVLLEIDL